MTPLLGKETDQYSEQHVRVRQEEIFRDLAARTESGELPRLVQPAQKSQFMAFTMSKTQSAHVRLFEPRQGCEKRSQPRERALK